MDSSDQRFASSDFVPKHRPWLLGRLLGYLRPYKWWVLISVLLGVLTIGSGVALLATSAWLISAAALQPSIADLSLAIVGVRFFGISRGIFRYLERLASHSVTFRLLANLRTSFYASLEPLAPAVFLRYQSGELFSRIVSDVEGLKEFYVRVIAPPAVATVISAAVLIFLANFHPLLAIGLLPFVLAAGLVLPGVVSKMTRGTGKDLVTIRASFQSKLADNILGMADLLVFDQERLAANEIFMLSRRFVILQRRLARTRAFHAGSNVLLSNLALLVILLSAVVLTGQGKLDAVYLATLTLATWAAFEAYQPLPAAAENLESSLQVAERLYEITSAPADVIDLLDPLPPAESANLVVKNLRFKYQSAGPWILDGFNLDLPRGKWVAIVGPSGSGKSTITNILLRLVGISSRSHRMGWRRGEELQASGCTSPIWNGGSRLSPVQCTGRPEY